MQKFRRRFPLNSILVAVLGFLVGLLINAISVFLDNPISVTVVAALFLLVLVIFIVNALRTPIHVRVRFGAPVTLRKGDQSRYARRGLVAFVSLYNPSQRGRGREMDIKARLVAAAALDHAALDLENSNLETTIRAIRTHSASLEHLWLVGTSGTTDNAGSSAYIPVLAEYMLRELRPDCVLHTGSAYEISVEDDEQIYTKTYDLLQTIFSQATGLGLTANDVVVDFTSGIRSMSLGAVLASLDDQRDIEFVGARYDASGQLIPHDLFTMIFHFETIVSP